MSRPHPPVANVIFVVISRINSLKIGGAVNKNRDGCWNYVNIFYPYIDFTCTYRSTGIVIVSLTKRYPFSYNLSYIWPTCT